MDRKTKTLRERVLENLAGLRIPITADELDEVIAAAEHENLAFLEAIDRLLGEQVARRHERGIKRRITAAHFAKHKTLETFDWKFNKTINRAQYEQLATGDFIRRRANVVLVGQSGVGKRHLMQAVGLRACAHGYRVFHTTSAQMLIDLTAALADRSLNDTLKRYASWDLLLVDEGVLRGDRARRGPAPADLVAERTQHVLAFHEPHVLVVIGCVFGRFRSAHTRRVSLSSLHSSFYAPAHRGRPPPAPCLSGHGDRGEDAHCGTLRYFLSIGRFCALR